MKPTNLSTNRKSRLSHVSQSIPPSGIRRFFDMASSMKDVISLGVGEPDFVTAWNIREASIFSMERGFTTYTPNSGLPELRQKICAYQSQLTNVKYDADSQVVVTVGASEGIDIAMRAIIDPGDEVLVVEPCFVSYDPIVRLAGGVPVSVSTYQDQNFKVTPQLLIEKITPKTKAIIFCYPNNPTGSTFNQQELDAIASVVLEHDLLVISDEIYAELTYDDHHISFSSVPGMKERTILISGFSKAFAMTGWRIGYACGPADIIQAMIKIHQYAIMCAPIMGQKAAIEALDNGLIEKDKMKESYRQRRNFVVKAFKDIGLDCHQPEGAFYAFPSIRSTGLSSEQFAEQLLIEEKVAVVPGAVFGASGEGYIRCSYAASIGQLELAIERMGRFCSRQ